MSKFNVVFISVDCGRPDHFGCYGYKDGTTPNVDAFSKDCLIFKNAFTNAPSTLPSHSTVFTSAYPFVHGAEISTRSPLPKSLPTLASLLQRAGYATASFNGGAQLNSMWHINRGFDVYESDKNLVSGVDSAINWISENKSVPFFVFLHGYDVHKRLEKRGKRFNALFKDDSSAEKYSAELNTRLRRNPKASPEDRDAYVELYDDNLEVVDSALGKFFDFLKADGLLENTIVVIFSDHGEELGERSNVALHSHTLYDELLRVLLVMRVPNQKSKSVDSMVSLIDVTPTVLDFLGIKIPEVMQGKSLFPIIDGKESDRVIFSEFHYPAFAKMCVRTSTHKLIFTRHMNHGFFLEKTDVEKVPEKKPFFKRVRKASRKFVRQPKNMLARAFFLALEKSGLYKHWLKYFGLFKNYEFYDLEADPSEKNNLYYSTPSLAAKHVEMLEDFLKSSRKARLKVGSSSGKIEVNEQLKKRLNELGYI